MRTRIEILTDLIHLKKNLADLELELAQHPWDMDRPLIELTKEDLINTLQKAITGNISLEVIEDWANMIECRDDIEMAEKIQEYIFELASPILYGGLTIKRLMQIAEELS